MAAMHFSRIPPTGKTLPLKVISPVIAKFSRGGIRKSREEMQVTIVTPAEGPSFLVAPSGKWMCREIYSRYLFFSIFVSCWFRLPVIVRSSKWALIQEKAILTLSFITSPNCPVTYIFWRLLLYCKASTVSTFPPIWVQASPFTTPTPPQISLWCLFPKYSYAFSLVMTSFVPFRTTFRHIFEIFLSNSRTPSSLEYLITYLRP